MTLDIGFEPQGVARITARGEMSLPKIIEAITQLYADPRYKAPTRFLGDLLGGKAALTAADIRHLITYVRENRPPGRGRIAIVVKDDFSFGMGRMYELMADGGPTDVHIFRDLDTAREWLLEEF